MTEFCSRCGYQLDEITGRCPKCDQAALNNRKPKKRKKTDTLPWFEKPDILYWFGIPLCVCALILALVLFFEVISG